MKIEDIKLGKGGKASFARKHYRQWMRNTKEAAIFKAVLFALCRGKCPVCGVDMILTFHNPTNMSLNAATLDHTIPLRETLIHSKYGLEIMCYKCNIDKG